MGRWEAALILLFLAPFECSGENEPVLSGQTFKTNGLSPLVQQSLGVMAFKVRDVIDQGRISYFIGQNII